MVTINICIVSKHDWLSIIQNNYVQNGFFIFAKNSKNILGSFIQTLTIINIHSVMHELVAQIFYLRLNYRNYLMLSGKKSFFISVKNRGCPKTKGVRKHGVITVFIGNLNPALGN